METSPGITRHGKTASAGNAEGGHEKQTGEKNPEEVAEIVRQAVAEVDHGSVEPLDMLVKKRL